MYKDEIINAAYAAIVKCKAPLRERINELEALLGPVSSVYGHKT